MILLIADRDASGSDAFVFRGRCFIRCFHHALRARDVAAFPNTFKFAEWRFDKTKSELN